MEMTRNYENWEHEKSMNMDLTQVHTPRNNKNLHSTSNVTSYNPCDVDGEDEMEMTRNYGNLELEKRCLVSPPSKTPRNENYLQVASKVGHACSFVAQNRTSASSVRGQMAIL